MKETLVRTGKPELEGAFGQWMNTTLNLDLLKYNCWLSRGAVSSMTTRWKQHSKNTIRKAFSLVLLPSDQWRSGGWGGEGVRWIWGVIFGGCVSTCIFIDIFFSIFFPFFSFLVFLSTLLIIIVTVLFFFFKLRNMAFIDSC